MADVDSGMVLAGIAKASRIKRLVVASEYSGADIDMEFVAGTSPIFGMYVSAAVAGHAGGSHAVEGVYAPGASAEQVFHFSNTQ